MFDSVGFLLCLLSLNLFPFMFKYLIFLSSLQLIMVQKRPLGEEDLYEVSSKQPRHEPSCQLVSVLELSRESVVVDAYASGNNKLFC